MSTNNKHLTLNERKEIERLLNIDSKLGTIAKSIGKSDKCIRYEISNYRELQPQQLSGNKKINKTLIKTSRFLFDFSYRRGFLFNS